MSRYTIELATAEDDADLRRILAETPMPGRIALSFRREPSFFGAAVVEGRFCQVVAARESTSGRLVGFGMRSLRRVYINGRPEWVGYLSNLRLLPEHRHRGLVARGYSFFHSLHGDGRTPMYLTTIAQGNNPALALLTSGRAKLPVYHEAGNFHTVALPLGRRRIRPRAVSGLEIRSGTVEDLPALMDFLHGEGARRQFFPSYEMDDFVSPAGALRGLRPEDVLLASRGGRLVGALAGWDQQPFKQTMVQDYAGALRWLRPLVNGWARVRGLPPLPGRGEAIRSLVAAFPLVEAYRPEVFTALLDALLARAVGRWDFLLLGLSEADALSPVLRSYGGTCYTTRMFHVCWEDGDIFRRGLEGRVPYLELGSL